MYKAGATPKSLGRATASSITNPIKPIINALLNPKCTGVVALNATLPEEELEINEWMTQGQIEEVLAKMQERAESRGG